MRKIFNKAVSVLASVALVAALFAGVSGVEVKAYDEKDVAIKPWTFMHQGENTWGEATNVGVITSAKLTDSGDTITNFPLTEKYSTTASSTSKGFELAISNTGWDAKWGAGPNGEDLINPWSVQVSMNDVPMEAGHIYKVTFKAHATGKKYGYVAFGSDVIGGDGEPMAPYADAGLNEGSNNPIMTIGTADKEFTYIFTNYISATKLNMMFMLGAFDAQHDYAGNDVSDIITAKESNWSGTVYVSDFTIKDIGAVEIETPPDKPTVPSTQAPTVKPTVAPTVKPTVAPTAVKKLAKVKGLKVKNNKKNAISISWKKVSKAKSYQVKVGNKTYTTKKVKLTVNKLKKGKKYTVKVRAKATGYKTAAWTTRKIKIKK